MIVVRNFNTSRSPLNRTTGQSIIKELRALNEILEELVLVSFSSGLFVCLILGIPIFPLCKYLLSGTIEHMQFSWWVLVFNNSIDEKLNKNLNYDTSGQISLSTDINNLPILCPPQLSIAPLVWCGTTNNPIGKMPLFSMLNWVYEVSHYFPRKTIVHFLSLCWK